MIRVMTVILFFIIEYGLDFKNLHLHLKVEKPGKFCCNDGVCIDAKNVCDKIPHCEDQEDEDVDICVQISIPTTYQVHHAPIGFEHVNGELLKAKTKVDIAVNVMDLVNIDISDASFKIIFR